MNTVTLHQDGSISGMTAMQRVEMHKDFDGYDAVRRVERWSIREFMRENANLLIGRVLDYGAGTQPYRDLVKGEYVPWSPGQLEDVLYDAPFDLVMCNQVMQYVGDSRTLITNLFDRLVPGGRLVLTFATNWDEVEDNDLWRFTAKGMEYMLTRVGFVVQKMERRAEVIYGNFKFPLGYGCVVRKGGI